MLPNCNIIIIYILTIYVKCICSSQIIHPKLFFIVPPTALTATVSRLGTARAGMVYNLTCNVSKTVTGFINSPTATWTTGGVEVTNGNGIIASTVISDESAISTLTFNPLRTSHGKIYNCTGSIDSLVHISALHASVSTTVNIQSEMRIYIYMYCMYKCYLFPI